MGKYRGLQSRTHIRNPAVLWLQVLAAVLDYLRAIENDIDFFDDTDRKEWTHGMSKIKGAPLRLT